MAEEPSGNSYRDAVLPYLQKYCWDCHHGAEAKGELDLEKYAAPRDVIDNFRRWNHIIEFIRDGEMPPEDALQPAVTESNAAVAAIEAILLTEAQKHAGDPGVVLPRRLSRTEYDRSIRDLTGIDIRPTHDFPADPAGGEGFDNTGEALRMSPNLLKKFLAAAQLVSEHMVLKPDGMYFAPFPATSYNERKKLTEQAVIDFYERHEVNIRDYLEAAWRFRFRPDDARDTSLEAWAESQGLSGQYLTIVWNSLDAAPTASEFSQELRRRWDALPAPSDTDDTPPEFAALHEYIEVGRTLFTAPTAPLIQSNAGNWPINHLAFRSRVADARDRFDRAAFRTETLLRTARISAPPNNSPDQPLSLFLRFDRGFGDGDSYVILRKPVFSRADHLPRNDDETKNHQVESLRDVLTRTDPQQAETLGFGKHPAGGDLDGDSFAVQVPATIEIRLSPDLRRELNGRQLLVPCALDTERGPNGSALVQQSQGQPPQDRFTRGVQFLIAPGSQTADELAQAAEPFCHAFPNEFCYVDEHRGLAAGFHLVEGFFRDDRPLVTKVLNESERAELDRLWQELDFVTESAETLLRGFVWFERSEREVLHDARFDFLRAEDPHLVEDDMLTRFEKLYLDRLGVPRVGDTLEAAKPDAKYDMIHGFFRDIRSGLARQRELLETAETHALADLDDFARRAYRRPLRPEESASLRALYRKLRAEGQTVEGAVRGVLTAVLLSPDFCYRFTTVPDGPELYPLSDIELASRLSYFLWSSLPDDELLTAAAAGRLQDDDELLRQTRRMLKDSRVDGFATEFVAQWLRYRDYLDKDPINGEAFPGYDDELRQAMFAEPIRLATHLIQTDQPVTSLLNSDLTFLNQRLAAHYGGDLERQFQEAAQRDASRRPRRSTGSAGTEDRWYPVSGLQSSGRGGLFGMAVVLTKNSSGERTSPVKRGFWTVHHLLGQHFPPPPADVPELPKSEKEATRTIRELLAAHVAEPQCALCHKHFDNLGLAMEGFDPIGRSRTQDSAGRPVDPTAELPNGEIARGIPQLIAYIEEHRRQEFLRTLCRKFLGYALGRSVMLSDQPLLAEMETALAENEYRFSVLFEVVVRSPQFRRQRGRDFQTANRR